jgi:hypothetical protein
LTRQLSRSIAAPPLKSKAFGGSHQCVLLPRSYVQQCSSTAHIMLAVCCTLLLSL